MEKVGHKYRSFEESEKAEREYYRSLTPEQRLELLLDLVAQAQAHEVRQEFARVCCVVKLQDIPEPKVVVQLGRPPSRIDLLTCIDGVGFDQAWQGRVATELDGLPVSKQRLR